MSPPLRPQTPSLRTSRGGDPMRRSPSNHCSGYREVPCLVSGEKTVPTVRVTRNVSGRPAYTSPPSETFCVRRWTGRRPTEVPGLDDRNLRSGSVPLGRPSGDGWGSGYVRRNVVGRDNYPTTYPPSPRPFPPTLKPLEKIGGTV